MGEMTDMPAGIVEDSAFLSIEAQAWWRVVVGLIGARSNNSTDVEYGSPTDTRLRAPKRRENRPVIDQAVQDYLVAAGDELRLRRREVYSRARWTFVIVAALAIATIIVWALAAVLAPMGFNAHLIIPTILGAGSAGASALAWRMYRFENEHARRIDMDLLRLEEIRLALALDPDNARKGDFRISTSVLSPVDANDGESQ